MLGDSVLIGTPAQNIGNIVVSVVGLAATAGLIVWAARGHKPLRQLGILLAGAALACFGDPCARYLAGMIPRPGADGGVVIQVYGVNLPVWTFFALVPYIGYVGYLTFRALVEGWPRRRFWLLLVVAAVMDTVGEYVMIHVADLYVYAAPQPLVVHGLPLLWPWVFVALSMLMGAMVALLSRRVHGWRWLLALPVLGSGYLSCLAAVSWPTLVARGTGIGATAHNVLGVLSLATLFATLYLVSLFLPAGAPPPAPETAESRTPTASR